MTIDQLWNNALDYHQRFNLLFLAGYSRGKIIRLRTFFCQWDTLDFRVQQNLERAEWAGKYRMIQNFKVAKLTQDTRK